MRADTASMEFGSRRAAIERGFSDACDCIHSNAGLFPDELVMVQHFHSEGFKETDAGPDPGTSIACAADDHYREIISTRTIAVCQETSDARVHEPPWS